MKNGKPHNQMNSTTSGGTGQLFHLSVEPVFTVVHCLLVSCHLHTRPTSLMQVFDLGSSEESNPATWEFVSRGHKKESARKRAGKSWTKQFKSTRWKQSPHSCSPHSCEFERRKWNSALTWRLKSIPFRSES